MSDDLVKRESLAEDKVLDGSNCPRAFNPGGQVSHPTWKQKEVLTCFSSWNSFGSHHVSVGSYERKASSNSDMRPRWVKFLPMSWPGWEQTNKSCQHVYACCFAGILQTSCFTNDYGGWGGKVFAGYWFSFWVISYLDEGWRIHIAACILIGYD